MTEVRLTIRPNREPFEAGREHEHDIVVDITIPGNQDWPGIKHRLSKIVDRHIGKSTRPTFHSSDGNLIESQEGYLQLLSDCNGASPLPIFALVDFVEPPSPPAHPPEEPTSVFPEQKVVAERLLQKAKDCLKDRDLSDFTSLRALVFVPTFTTLQHQTIKRVKEAHLVGGKSGDVVTVLMYHIRSSASRKAYKLFTESAVVNERTLHVVIADECRWGPVISQAHDQLVNNADLDRPSVLRLLVSATPYNCLTKDSRVDPDREVNWSEEIKANTRSGGGINRPYRTLYRGLDDSTRSVAFTLHGERRALTFERKGPPRETRIGYLEDGDLYGTYEDLADAVEGRFFRDFGVKCAVVRRSGLHFRITMTGSWKLVWGGTDDNLLRSVGFTRESIDKGGHTFISRNPPTADADHPLRSQRIRQDVGFHGLVVVYNRKFDIRKGIQDGEVGETGQEEKLGGAIERKETKGGKKKKPAGSLKEGHVTLVDYMLALAYFAVFRVDEKWQDNKDEYCFLEPLDPNDSQHRYTEANVRRYLDVVTQLADFEAAGPTTAAVQMDLKPVVAWLLHTRASKAAEERCLEVTDSKGKEGLDYDFLIPNYLHIFKELLKAERGGHSTTAEESWYTETERAVHDLLSVDPKSGRGRTTVVRVYDSDECLSFQTGLRSAVMKLGLVCGKTRRQPLSVLNDIGTTVIYQHIESYFLRLQLSDRDPKTLQATTMEKEEGVLSYEDLNSVPCLLILCNKGRLVTPSPRHSGPSTSGSVHLNAYLHLYRS